MLSLSEIKRFLDEDAVSEKKLQAAEGQRYYEAEHDIKNARLFYYNADGVLVEDKTRSNIKISHPFFTEIADQTVQYIFSGEDGFIKSDIPELQTELDSYFNKNEDFVAELTETVTGSVVKGFDYMHSYKNDNDRTAFQCADSMGVIEVAENESEDGQKHVLYWYIDRIDKGHKKIKRIQDWDSTSVRYYVQADDGEIEKDSSEKVNPKPHILYQPDDNEAVEYDEFGYIPFFRLDYNKKQQSGLKVIKEIIDDYDIHACSLSNNLIDFDRPLHVVKGFQGDNLDELQQNLKTKKIIGVDAEGGVEVHTVEIPYQARLAKLELDEKNIYKFGMALNTHGLKDTNATTNIAIKMAYSLLDLKVSKLTIRLKQFLRKLIKVVLDETNAVNGTDYQQKDVYFNFEHEVMTNEQENAAVKKIEAETEQIRVNTILNVSANIGDKQTLKAICEQMELDFEELKGQLDLMNEGANTATAKTALEGVEPIGGDAQ